MSEFVGYATSVIVENGGYMTFDEFDAALDNRFLPYFTGAGWGDPFTFKQNQKVFCAAIDVEAGLIITDGNGYKLNNTQEQQS